ncbi:hypothetical protein ACUOFC_47825, partial [Escherichia sp. TWPC-MK]
LYCALRASRLLKTGANNTVHCWRVLTADVSYVIKHYAAKGRIEPNHKIDSALAFPVTINFAYQNN